MPELPDITLYLHALAPRVLQQPIERLRIANPFVGPRPVATAQERLAESLDELERRKRGALIRKQE